MLQHRLATEPSKPKMAPPPPPRNKNGPKEIHNEMQTSTSNGYIDARKSTFVTINTSVT